MPDLLTVVTDQLRGHQRRRELGLPRVTVLVGAESTARRIWRAWARRGRPPGLEIEEPVDPAHCLETWLQHAERETDLISRAQRYLAPSQADPQGADLSVGVAFREESGQDPALAAHARRLAEGGSSAALRRCGASCDQKALLRTAEELLPLAPALLLHPAIRLPDSLSAAARLAAWWAEAAPRLPVAITTPAARWQDYLAVDAATHAGALLREGCVRLASAASAEPRGDDDGTAGLDPPPELAAQLTQTSQRARHQPQDPAAAAAARSAAEAFLHACLDRLEATAGRFELAGDPGFRFGGRRAEVDLLCSELRIAIEIDGWYHFQDPEAYRRDRRKDVLLQQHGFVVLRILADDVVDRLEQILAAIVNAVTWAELRSATPHEGEST